MLWGHSDALKMVQRWAMLTLHQMMLETVNDAMWHHANQMLSNDTQVVHLATALHGTQALAFVLDS